MKPLDHEKLAAALVSGARQYIDKAIGPIMERLAAAEQRADAAEAMIAEMVAKAVSDIPLPKDGKDGAPGRDGADGMTGERGADGAPGAQGRGIAKLIIRADGHLVATFTDGSTDDVGLVVGRDGKDGQDGRPGEKGADGKDGRNGLDGQPGERGADGAPGRDGDAGQPGQAGADGKSVDAAEVAEMVKAEVEKASIADLVQRAVDQIPRPRDGKDGERGEKGEPGSDGANGRDGKDGAPGEKGADGKDGRDGKLPIAKAWHDTVHREGDVVTHEGATYQASRDTGKMPPHADWICLAARGADGASAEQIEVRGTFSPDAEYGRLNIVALNGSAFISRQANPGMCPGEGWQLIAMRGKEGKPGQSIKGDPGPSVKGDPGPSVRSMSVDGQGLLTLVNGDGSHVECDLYPVLSKIGGH